MIRQETTLLTLLHCYTILLINLSYTKRIENNSVSHNSSVEVYRSSEHPMFPLGNPEYRMLQKILFLKNTIILEEYGSGQVKKPHGKDFPKSMPNSWKKIGGTT